MNIGLWQLILIFVMLLPFILVGMAFDGGKGTKGRLAYLFSLVIFIVSIAASTVLSGIYNLEAIWSVSILIVGFCYLAYSACQRLREIGVSRWWVLLLSLPIINLVFILYCAIVPSSADK